MVHKYKIGQVVDLQPNRLQSQAPGRYEICFLIPSSDREPHNPRYRIKSISEAYERAAAESKLTLSCDLFG